jgi:hypothetical protein
MKKAIYLLISATIFFTACTENKKSAADLVNQKASLPTGLNFGNMGFKVITSSINTKLNTMSTLYGNELARANAISGVKLQPAGETFALITWKKQADEHWFGANIPGDLQSVEMVKTTIAGATYQCYEGHYLVLSSDTAQNQQRIKYIFEQQPSVMP